MFQLFIFTSKLFFIVTVFCTALMLFSCASDTKKKEEVKQETKKEQTLRPISLGGGTDTLPAERQIQRYQAALESLERFEKEQGATISPEVKRELEFKIKDAKAKIDSLSKLKK